MQKWKMDDDAVAWTSEDGEWVAAEVAQGLYRALLAATSELQAMKEQVGYRAMTMDVIREGDKALAAADGEEA